MSTAEKNVHMTVYEFIILQGHPVDVQVLYV